MEFINLAKGKFYIYADKLFSLRKVISNTQYFSCTNCIGTLKNENNVITIVRSHSNSCHFCPEFLESRRVLSVFEERAASYSGSLNMLVEEMIASVSSPVARCFGSSKSLYNSFLRLRNKRFVLPRSLNDLIFDDSVCKTEDGLRFLIADEMIENDRIVIFGSRLDCLSLARAHRISMDGTFETCPRLFKQIYTIHSFEENKLYPRLYCLITGKSRILYRKMIRMIKDHFADVLNVNFAPSCVIVDFEKAIKSVMREEFPGIVVEGCLFHHSSACLKYIRCNGLLQHYNGNDRFRTFVRMLMSLPFLRLADVEPAFLDLKQRAENLCPEVLPFFSYFCNEWMHDITVWNVYKRERRTNNNIEGWHYRFSKFVGVSHPNVWRLFNEFVKEEKRVRIREERIDSTSENDPVQKKTYELQNKKIVSLTNKYDQEQISRLRFLYRMSHLQISVANSGGDGSLVVFNEMFGDDGVDFLSQNVDLDDDFVEDVSEGVVLGEVFANAIDVSTLEENSNFVAVSENAVENVGSEVEVVGNIAESVVLGDVDENVTESVDDAEIVGDVSESVVSSILEENSNAVAVSAIIDAEVSESVALTDGIENVLNLEDVSEIAVLTDNFGESVIDEESGFVGVEERLSSMEENSELGLTVNNCSEFRFFDNNDVQNGLLPLQDNLNVGSVSGISLVSGAGVNENCVAELESVPFVYDSYVPILPYGLDPPFFMNDCESACAVKHAVEDVISEEYVDVSCVEYFKASISEVSKCENSVVVSRVPIELSFLRRVGKKISKNSKRRQKWLKKHFLKS